MKAFVYRRYGGPEKLQRKEVKTPRPKDNEVLIQVRASSINSWDADLLRGNPFLVRLASKVGPFRPPYPILGADVAGVIVSVGSAVRDFTPGDEVLGDLSEAGWGCFAEYVTAPAAVLTQKPQSMSFAQAAATPQAGVLAFQGLCHTGGLKQGQRVLINGAGGGVGTFAVQIAKHHGAEVTGVDRQEKFAVMRSLGADHCIDYRQENFTRNGKTYDLILDVMTCYFFSDYRRALAPGGVYVMIGGIFRRLFRLALTSLVWKPEGKQMKILGHKPSPSDMMQLIKLYETAKIAPVVDSSYALDDLVSAFRHFLEGCAKGKIVITM